MTELRAQLIAVGLLRPARLTGSDGPSPQRPIDAPTLRLDRLALQEVERERLERWS